MISGGAGAMGWAGGESCLDGTSTGLTSSVLTEISHLLNNLSERGESASINLRSLPMTKTDRLHLEELLGRGEVHVDLALAGASEAWETCYPGVWWIRHRGMDGRITSEEIAVTPIPEILVTHPEDVRTAATRLKNDLALFGETSNQSAGNEQNDVEILDAQP